MCEILKKSMQNFFFWGGGGTFSGKVKKRCGKTFGGVGLTHFFRGGNFWKNFKKKILGGNFKGGSYVGGGRVVGEECCEI